MIPPILVKIFGKDELSAVLGGVNKSIGKAGKKMSSLGKNLTASVSLPLAIAGASAFKMSMDFNKSMANVGTLIPGNKKRLEDLKKEVQSLAVETGKSTGEVAEGLFQMISAFGDGPETMKRLRLNARASVGGVSQVADAIALTSLATKAYGDTSEKATKSVLDLAFKANEKGKTSFEEMATTMGKVIPMGKALGASHEELFAVMGTFTGVTGNTSEVVTQLASVFGAFLKPSGDMEKAFKSLGVKGGAELIKKFGGVRQAMNAVSIFAEKNNVSLGKLLGRKEALNLVLSATGAQQKKYIENLKAMDSANGSADKAFEAQANGINKVGFQWEQLTTKVSVFAQKLGDLIGSELSPFIVKLGNLTQKFNVLTPSTKKAILVIGALLIIIPPLIAVMGGLAIAVTAVGWPVLLVVGIIAILIGLISIIIIKWKTWGKWIKLLGVLVLVALGPLGLLVLAIITIGKHWDQIVSKFKTGFKFIGGILSKVGNFFSGDGGKDQSFSNPNSRFNSTTGSGPGINNTINNVAQNKGASNTNNAKVGFDFSGLAPGVKAKVTADPGVVDPFTGLMGAGGF